MIDSPSGFLRHAFAAVLSLALAGCSASGFSAMGAGALAVPSSTAAPSQGKTLVKIARAEGLLFAAAHATVKVNGAKVADLLPGGSVAVEIAPGKTTLTVDAWSYPGIYTLVVDAKANTTQAFEVAPREGNVAPNVVLGPFGNVVDQGDSGNSGAFQITQVAATNVASSEAPAKSAKKR